MRRTPQRRKESFVLGQLLHKIAPKIGATVYMEPTWGLVGRITFKTGNHSYFRYNTLDLNRMGSSEIAKDKDYADFFMKALGYSTVPGSKTFYSDAWGSKIGKPEQNIDAAYQHALELGFPVITKPNSGSQGRGVALVHNKTDFYTAMKRVFKSDRVGIVQQPVYGNDYRVVVLDNSIISAYLRIPLTVEGDGVSTIAELLEIKQRQFIATNRDTNIKMTDPRIRAKLAHQHMTLKTIPEAGMSVQLLDNANLSTGGESVDVTDTMHPGFKDIAVKLTHDMGLRLCGVDLIVNGDIKDAPTEYWILEINSAPGLDHYASTGAAQRDIVEDLYLKVLTHMEY